MIKKYCKICLIGLILAFASNSLKADNPTAKSDEQQNLDTNPIFYEKTDYIENEKIRFDRLFETFLTSQKNLINHTMISFSTGGSFNILPETMNANNLTNLQSFGFEYGFVRFDSVFRQNKLRAYSSEFAYIESNTNKFGIYRKAVNSIYDNQFSFGFGLRSGFGLKVSKNNFYELYLLHSSAFSWTHFDYAEYQNSNFFVNFDNNTKFGFKGTASAELRLSRSLFLDLEYEHNNIFSEMEYGKWFGSWTIDFVLQRWIDVFDPIFADKLGYQYPFIKFFYKNSIAIILSEIRNLHQFYPFKSDYSLLQRKLIFKMKFIF